MTTLAEKAYITAVAASRAVEEAWMECEHGPNDTCVHENLVKVADTLLEKAMVALEESPRSWMIYEGGHCYTTVEANSCEAALSIARSNVDRRNYHEILSTVWIDVFVRCALTGEEKKDQVTLNPEEPSCAQGAEHEWTTPLGLVGGLVNNPGVFGHGGGVIIKEVCGHCGCERVRDTWAQNRETGQQGVESIAYEARKYTPEEIQASAN